MRVILILHPRCIGRCIAIVKLFQWEIKLISYFHLAGYVSALRLIYRDEIIHGGIVSKLLHASRSRNKINKSLVSPGRT